MKPKPKPKPPVRTLALVPYEAEGVQQTSEMVIKPQSTQAVVQGAARGEASRVMYLHGLSADDLALLGTLGSVLPALEGLHLTEPKLTRLTTLVALSFSYTRIADASCAVLAAALDSVLPSLERVNLHGIPASAAERDAMLRLGMDHGLAVEWLDPVYK